MNSRVSGDPGWPAGGHQKKVVLRALQVIVKAQDHSQSNFVSVALRKFTKSKHG